MVRVAVAGGSGQVAKEVVDALLASKKHHVTILSRQPMATNIDSLEWKMVDYGNPKLLVEALKGTHTVLSFIQILADPGQSSQKALIDAAITAGVKRFAPSEYGSRGLGDMPWWSGKAEIREYLEEVNAKEMILEYTLFQPGLFLDYLAYPFKTAKYLEPLQSVFDFQNNRAIVVDGYDDAALTLTTVTDVANIVTRAVGYSGKWPVMGGIRGNRVTISQLLDIGSSIKGQTFEVEKVKVQDLEAGELKTSWDLEAVHHSVPADQAAAALKAVSISLLLSSSRGAWDSSDDYNQIFPDYEYAPIDRFLGNVWRKGC